MFSLATRLHMARLALIVEADQADVYDLAGVMHAGIDLLIIKSSSDGAADEQTLRSFREQWAQTQMLLGTSNQEAAERAAADVVHNFKPGWFSRHLTRPHEWSLLGRNARDARAIRSPGEEYNYLIIGPTDDPESRAVQAALESQPPLVIESLPWFVQCSPEVVPGMLAGGARRFAFELSKLEETDPAEAVHDALALVDAAWKQDERAQGYRSQAFAL